MVKKIATVLAIVLGCSIVFLLFGCDADANEPQIPMTKVGLLLDQERLYKFCDGPNLVYVLDSYSGGNKVAVVGGAPECAR